MPTVSLAKHGSSIALVNGVFEQLGKARDSYRIGSKIFSASFVAPPLLTRIPDCFLTWK